MAAALNVLRSAVAGISPRERTLVMSLAGVLALMLLGGMWWWSSTALDNLETERADLVDALRTIRNERPRIRLRQQRHDRMLARYADRAPALTSFIESAAQDANVQVAEATDRTTPPAEGRRFQRRAVSIRLRHVDLQSLVSFMEHIDAAPFPVAVTSIRIHKRFGESNSYDVDDMVISTWDRVQAAASTRRTGGTAGGSGAAGAGGRGSVDNELGGR
ncbi:MAG: hypothetical protein WCJ30_14655 [Deltaproteobacteria bacterium]